MTWNPTKSAPPAHKVLVNVCQIFENGDELIKVVVSAVYLHPNTEPKPSTEKGSQFTEFYRGTEFMREGWYLTHLKRVRWNRPDKPIFIHLPNVAFWQSLPAAPPSVKRVGRGGWEVHE